MFAAVYLDGGFAAAKTVIDRQYAPLIAELDPNSVRKDAKTALQEWLQARKLPLPRYELDEVSGEAHAQQFQVVCTLERPAVRTLGTGSSRRIAEQQAAAAALAELPADGRSA